MASETNARTKWRRTHTNTRHTNMVWNGKKYVERKLLHPATMPRCVHIFTSLFRAIIICSISRWHGGEPSRFAFIRLPFFDDFFSSSSIFRFALTQRSSVDHIIFVFHRGGSNFSPNRECERCVCVESSWSSLFVTLCFYIQFDGNEIIGDCNVHGRWVVHTKQPIIVMAKRRRRRRRCVSNSARFFFGSIVQRMALMASWMTKWFAFRWNSGSCIRSHEYVAQRVDVSGWCALFR